MRAVPSRGVRLMVSERGIESVDSRSKAVLEMGSADGMNSINHTINLALVVTRLWM